MFLTVYCDYVLEHCTSYSIFVIILHKVRFSNKIYGIHD